MAAKKRKGGLRQRQAEAEEAVEAATGQSQLSKLLLSKFAWGELSPQAVQEIAAAAATDMETMVDGKCMPDLRALAAIGSNGAQAQNCFRDLMRKLEADVHLPDAYTAKGSPSRRSAKLLSTFCFPTSSSLQCITRFRMLLHTL